MEAIVKSNRKIIDVQYVGRTKDVLFFQGSDGKVYPEDALEFIEYYGG